MIFLPPLNDQKKMKAFIERRHPDYAVNVSHWTFLEATYRGGRAWFKGNIFRYMKEGVKEFGDRIARAFRFNHTREVVDLVNKYIFRAEIHRNRDDADESVRSFWEKATRSGLPIDQFMEQVSQRSSIYGRIWVVVDNNATSRPISKAEEKALDISVFAYIVKPEWVLDMAFDYKGDLEWILIFEPKRADENPFESSGKFTEFFRLWTRDAWFLFKKEKKGRKVVITLHDAKDHKLGVVPVFKVDNVESESAYTSPALIGEIAYLDRATANYLSNLDAIIQDQTFSQLAMPAQGLVPGSDEMNALIDMGTKRIFIYDGEGGVQPHYLSPDPKQASMILEVINKIIAEIYHSVGMAGERTNQDNAMGIDNSSGVAKAFDFDRVNAMLSAKADSLDRAENKMIHLVRKWHGEDSEISEDLVKYPDDYDVRGLYDEFDVAMRLSAISAPESMRSEQMKLLIEKLFPRISKALREKMTAEVEEWAKAEVNLLRPQPNLGKGSRQGQVTSGEDDKTMSG